MQSEGCIHLMSVRSGTSARFLERERTVRGVRGCVTRKENWRLLFLEFPREKTPKFLRREDCKRGQGSAKGAHTITRIQLENWSRTQLQ